MPLASLSEESSESCRLCGKTVDSKEKGVLACQHVFHKACLADSLEKPDTCPICEITEKQVHPALAATLNQAVANNTRQKVKITEPISVLASRPPPTKATVSTLSTAPVESVKVTPPISNDDVLRSGQLPELMAHIVDTCQATLMNSLSSRIADLVEEQIAQGLSRLNLQANNQSAAPTTSRRLDETPHHNDWPTEMSYPNNSSPRESRNDVRGYHRFSESTSVADSSRIAHLISSWNIKFDGSPKVTVENFIARIEVLVCDRLGGNFNLLLDHVHCLFTGNAEDWFWRFRISTQRVSWPGICESLRANFGLNRSDEDVKELMRSRKQKASETFDDYRDAVLKLSEGLRVPIPENELLEILQKGLQWRVRQQLLYVPIRSIAQLRQLCLKEEAFSQELTHYKNSQASPKTVPLKRQVFEVEAENHQEEEDPVEVEAIDRTRTRLICWNCRKEGHRWIDCPDETRNLYCYSCGAPNVTKLNCVLCKGNAKLSGGSKRNPRED